MDKAPRVHRFVGYGLEVPDVNVAEHFFGAFGLQTRRRGDALELRSQRSASKASEAEILVARGGTRKRLQHLSFAVDTGELDRFEQHLKRMGVPAAAPPFGRVREGLWFQDPWGTWINLIELDPVPPGPPTPSATGQPRVDRHFWRELNRDIKPNKLGHALLFTQDWERAESFFVAALGLRVSDRAAGKVTFLSAGAGVRDHHCFGLINSTHRGIQHSSFQVDTLDHVGLGGLQMYNAGYQESFGVGRHALASNLFHYTRDPWGSWIEYYADMDQISEAWVTRDWNELPYIWPQWAPEFWRDEMNGNHEPR